MSQLLTYLQQTRLLFTLAPASQEMYRNFTIVFLDPDFLYDAGIPATRKHSRQKLVYLCLHRFSGLFLPKIAVLGAKYG